MKSSTFLCWFTATLFAASPLLTAASERTRVLVTSDGEIDDECSLVRFLLYTNEWDVEGIITSSSQYHAHGHNWAGDDWAQPYLQAYAEVYPNLIQHDPRYPTPAFLQSRTLLGNVQAEGEMDEVTPGSRRIVEALLDASDPRPIWVQAWGGTNTIARALKTVEDEHPERMAEVAAKLRFYFIWEQDGTYQSYIRPHWGRFNIPTIISDQFIALFYHWKKYLPEHEQSYLFGSWMKPHILENHGPLCALYQAHVAGDKGFDAGDFRSEGDSPAFFHTIPTGLRNLESPGWGGWGGRFVKVRDNTWLDPVAEPGYHYPEGRWYTSNAWGRTRLKKDIPHDAELTAYLKPQWRWIDAIQNDFAARADWCVKPYAEANHPPIVQVVGPLDRSAQPGETVKLTATATDPDGDTLAFKWWVYAEAGTASTPPDLVGATTPSVHFVVPPEPGRQLHLILEVTDSGSPSLVRYQRVVITITP